MTEPKVEEKETASSLLNKKYGPFPVWLYLVIFGLIIFLWLYLKRGGSSDTSNNSVDTQSTSTLPPFINQVYTNSSPPDSSSPNPPSKFKTVKTANAHTIADLMKTWGLSEKEFANLNPGLAAKYMNTGKKIPKGTALRLPADAKSNA